VTIYQLQTLCSNKWDKTITIDADMDCVGSECGLF